MLKLDWNILFNIINILVLFLLLKKFLFKPVTEMMEKRQQTITASFADADSKNKEADRLKQEYETALKNAEASAVNIINEAKQRASEEHDRQIAATKDEIAGMLETAKKTIEVERQVSMQKVQSEIANIAMLAATKLIQKNINDSTNNKILNDFLAEAGTGK